MFFIYIFKRVILIGLYNSITEYEQIVLISKHWISYWMDWSCPIHFNVLAIRLACFSVGGPPCVLTLYNRLLISSWKSNFKFSEKFRVGGKLDVSWSSSEVILSWESRRSWVILQKINMQNIFSKICLKKWLLFLFFYIPWFWSTFL